MLSNGEDRELREIQERFLQGIGRSSTVIIGSQIRLYLTWYFSLGELLLVVISVHVLLCFMPAGVSGFRASWDMLRGLMQSVVVQLLVAYVSGGGTDFEGLLNLLGVLMVAESLPAFSGWVGDDVASLTTTISFTFSDEVSAVLRETGVPAVGSYWALRLEVRGSLGRP
jgi:hypothetical protein